MQLVLDRDTKVCDAQALHLNGSYMQWDRGKCTGSESDLSGAYLSPLKTFRGYKFDGKQLSFGDCIQFLCAMAGSCCQWNSFNSFFSFFHFGTLSVVKQRLIYGRLKNIEL